MSGEAFPALDGMADDGDEEFEDARGDFGEAQESCGNVMPSDAQQDMMSTWAPTSAFGAGEPLDEAFTTGGPSQGEWSKQQTSTDSRDRWSQKTIDNLNNAKALTRYALRHVLENDSHMHSKSARAATSSTGGVAGTIKRKIGMTEDLVKAIEDRIESVEDTIRQVGECLFQLQRAHRSKWAPLNVCERRLQLRETRPIQELVRDACQESLETERQVLIEARQELADQIEGMKEMLVTLDRMKGELLEDLQQKRHSLRVDRTCLSPRKPLSTPGQKERLVLPSLNDVVHYGQPLSPKSADAGHGQEEAPPRTDTRGLLQAAVRTEEDAMRLCNESDAAMLHTKRECTRASNRALAELSRTVDGTNGLRKQLEAQIGETDETIAQMEMSLARTRKKLDSHDQPLRALDKQFSMRGQRGSEGDQEAVNSTMEGHLESLKKSVRALTAKFQDSKAILDQLRSAKQKMQEDYRCKCLAQKIDDACVKVTPRKAIELDRMDPRGGRCREPARKKQSPRDVSSFQGSFSDGFA